jgi:hypothetical protein
MKIRKLEEKKKDTSLSPQELADYANKITQRIAKN